MFKHKSRKFVVLLGVIGALVFAGAAFAIWTVYTATIDGTSTTAGTNQAASNVGAFLITPGTVPTGEQGFPGNAASVVLHVVNRDSVSHQFGGSSVVVGTPTVTGGSGGCTLSQLTTATASSIQTRINAVTSVAGGSSDGTFPTGAADIDVTNAYTVNANAPSSCAGTTLNLPLSGTLSH